MRPARDPFYAGQGSEPSRFCERTILPFSRAGGPAQ
jgi:hypothetical protein